MLNDVMLLGDKVARRGLIEEADVDLLTNKKALQKISRAFERTPHVFNFYVIADEKRKDFSLITNQKAALKKLLGRPVDTKGKITIVYTTNVTGPRNRMPMNAWTLAHRIGHNMQANYVELAEGGRAFSAEERLWGFMVDIYNEIATDPVAKLAYGRISFSSHDDNINKLFFLLGTMKSARDANLHNPMDVACEVMAQYIITGKVRFNRVADWDEFFYRNIDAAHGYEDTMAIKDGVVPDHARRRHPNPVFDANKIRNNAATVNAMIDNMERIVNLECAKVLKSLEGQILGW